MRGAEKSDRHRRNEWQFHSASPWGQLCVDHPGVMVRVIFYERQNKVVALVVAAVVVQCQQALDLFPNLFRSSGFNCLS